MAVKTSDGTTTRKKIKWRTSKRKSKGAVWKTRWVTVRSATSKSE